MVMLSAKEIDHLNVLTERVSRLKQRCEDSVPHICSERSRLATESWKETEGQPLDIRRAKLFRRIMQGNPIAIRNDELIVGSQSQYIRGSSPPVDNNPQFAIDTLQAKRLTASSVAVTAEITQEERESLLLDCHFWKGRSTSDAVIKEIEAKFPWLKDWIESGIVHLLFGSNPPDVKSVDYSKVINIGFEGVIAEAKESLGRLEYSNAVGDYDKDCFLQAAIIACEGAIEYAHRYAGLAEEMAAKENNPLRKRELERIAGACRRVPAKPARNFYEALQSFWLTHICVNLETAALGEAPGRIDQYLYPFYKRDVIDEGTLTRQEAAELLGCLFVKLNEVSAVKAAEDKERTAGTHLQDVTIGGISKDGVDASNELSYLLLEVLAQVPMPQPPIYVRYHPQINQEVWAKAVEVVVRRGDGNPAFVNDAPRISSFTEHGIALEDARDWVVGGCAGSITPGLSLHGAAGHLGYINMAKVLEFVLHNGCDPRSGKQIGLATGDPRQFSSIEQILQAFKRQVDYFFNKASKMSQVLYAVDIANYRTPFCSAILGDCISRGMDSRKGGVRYPEFITHVSDRSLQNVADSLAAIKKVAFEDKRLNMAELLDAINQNFEGNEALRRTLLAAPKYGNDDDYVDNIFNELSLWLQDRIGREKTPFGTRLWQGRTGATVHWMLGRTTGALPDGRKSGEPLADGFLSPGQGRDTKGPTAVIMSATKANHNYNSVAALMNMKFDRNMLSNETNRSKFANLVETFFKRGGFHIQVNILSKEILLAAQERPDQHRNLMVRVAGYSAYFVDLPRALQDEILSRTTEQVG
jgi:pyruvate formate-lyase/glycerol dehydratase family glycyl radical enzyme